MSIRRGEFVYVVGPNAAGKTTLLETVNGLLKPVRGTVEVLGRDMSKNGRQARCQIGYVPQDFVVDPGEPYTALDVVLMGMFGKIGVMYRLNGADVKRALETMALLDVDGLSRRPMGKLSGGQQQKVMIARALAKEPRVLLLDEPFSNLDADSRRKVPDLIGQLHKEKDMTTIIVTHDVTHVSDRCNRVVVMERGRIVADEGPLTAFDALRTYQGSLSLEVMR
ncbi:MAG: ATP-binding cassette domain-containing protein [Candidatus Bathyarchaeia archaeon]